FIPRLRSMGIRDRPTSPRSPWQNGYAERLIGSIRRECLDHVVVFSERHPRHLLRSYMRCAIVIIDAACFSLGSWCMLSGGRQGEVAAPELLTIRPPCKAHSIGSA